MKSLILLSIFFLTGCGESILSSSSIGDGLGPLSDGTHLFIPGSNGSLGGDGNFYDGTCTYGQTCFFGGFIPEGNYLLGARVETHELCKKTPALRSPFVPGNLDVTWERGQVSHKIYNQCDGKVLGEPRDLAAEQVEGFTFFHPDLGVESPIIVTWHDLDRPQVGTRKYLFSDLATRLSSSSHDIQLGQEYFMVCHIDDSPFADINSEFKTSFIMKRLRNATQGGLPRTKGYLVVGERDVYLDSERIDFLYTDAFDMSISQEDFNLSEGYMRWKYLPNDRPVSVEVDVHTREVLGNNDVMVTLKIRDGDISWHKRTPCTLSSFTGDIRDSSDGISVQPGGSSEQNHQGQSQGIASP